MCLWLVCVRLLCVLCVVWFGVFGVVGGFVCLVWFGLVWFGVVWFAGCGWCVWFGVVGCVFVCLWGCDCVRVLFEC